MPKQADLGSLSEGNFCESVIDDGRYSAASYFNDGNTSVQSMLCELKLTPGHFTGGGLHKADDMRIYFAKRKSLQTSKMSRKILRAEKNLQDKRRTKKAMCMKKEDARSNEQCW